MNNKKVSWFKRQKIYYKIIMIYFPLVIIPLLIVSGISLIINSNSTIETAEKNVADESKLIVTRIDSIVNQAESFSISAMLDLNKEVKLKELPPVIEKPNEILINDDYELRNQVENRLAYAQMIFPEVESAVYIDRNYYIYKTDNLLVEGTVEGIKSEMFEQVEQSNGSIVWFSMQTRDYWTLDNDQPVLTLGKKILDTNTMELMGYLFVNINEKALSNVYDTIGIEASSGYYIVDGEGMIISSNNSEDILSYVDNGRWEIMKHQDSYVMNTTNTDGKEIIQSSLIFETHDWRLINEIRIDELTSEILKVSRLIVIVAVFALVLAIIGAIILSRSIASPIIVLAKHMSRIRDGNLNKLVEVDSYDEIGVLSKGLNMMLVRISDLLTSIKEEQTKKREYELALIQEQIKPHFFYNTLELIYIFCKSGDGERASKATKALGDFYRVALSNGRELITLGEEINNLNSYLYIQQMRYSDLFNFTISVDEKLKEYIIPKLTLQPLVENAIYHGLKESRGFGSIHISGYIDGQLIHIVVADNGVGMEETQLQKIMSSESHEQHFGMRSVNERIKLYFGENYGLKIKSKQNEGTQITIIIPNHVRGEQHV
ncbi:MAG: sensor histidine kinase [Candidatus Pristimantibacillus lignocellulolyticus]|uniref:Sensor histidine kinase n=1 Tax=Candidatus Pristimantibacillus lignocellulolyticus TaxID=2994561 RepID=A0A9J6ZFN3_9BACL|nr:MAG: sensor histidine kinase [Candidatus Pristimantibacillus lignocellulolyticus]